ncbi:MAG: serine/threonine protein kinase [Planctomycetales bacterium]|nr:serine/threonine protein kinase [Planctomycetales bacterium]MCA9223098.1 serine/threonine protein kinase [Planctomycetales bacterium]
MIATRNLLRSRQKLGKYRIETRLAEGGFAAVYKALDTIEGIHVALKSPHPSLVTESLIEDFRREVRLAARLDHPNILPIKNAEFVGDNFIVAFALGIGTLADRLTRRLSGETALDFTEQMLEGLSYAHENSIIHCDVKPENFILFPDDRLRLTDFGIAKVAMRTIKASGSGTVGYIAPEQAMGKPSFRSDVFSAGLIIYRMFAGKLPEWPFDWPPPGIRRARQRVHPDFLDFMRRAIELEPRRRFADGGQMLRAFRRLRARALSVNQDTRRGSSGSSRTRDWKTIRRRQFMQQFGKALECTHRCHRCEGPVSEAMMACPWCGVDRGVHRGETRMPAHCPRCHRGMKLDWPYCAWCYGPGFHVGTRRQYSDVRYSGRCSNPSCERKLLMPFMRYCPWCHRKVRKKWMVPGSTDRCGNCGWGVVKAFWDHCPWCTKRL